MLEDAILTTFFSCQLKILFFAHFKLLFRPLNKVFFSERSLFFLLDHASYLLDVVIELLFGNKFIEANYFPKLAFD